MIRNYPLTGHNSFGLDVMAAWACKIFDIRDLEKIIQSSVFADEKHIILGGGSNCLFLDDYFEGLVLLIKNKGITIVEESDNSVIVSVAAGENWSDFVDSMVVRGYGGLENLSLIPGKVGAAPIQNIGAYGVELMDVFVGLQALDLHTRELVNFNREACEFGYRSSLFKTSDKDRYVILSIDVMLHKNHTPNISYGSVTKALQQKGITKPGISDVAQIVKEIRQAKLPDPAVLGNAGSFFKNPLVHNLVFQNLKNDYPELRGYPESYETTKISAAWLIEKAGWKGKRIGDAGVHTKQALVLVNYGKANGRDIYSLAMEIQQDVKNKFGVVLEPEVNFI